MAVKWSVRRLKYELSKDGKSNVVTSAYWNADDSKEITKDDEKIIAPKRIKIEVYKTPFIKDGTIVIFNFSIKVYI